MQGPYCNCKKGTEEREYSKHLVAATLGRWRIHPMMSGSIGGPVEGCAIR